MSHLTVCFQLRQKKGVTLPSCFSSQSVNKHPSQELFSARYFIFLCFSVDFTIGKGPSAHCCVPKYKKILMYLMEKTGVR